MKKELKKQINPSIQEMVSQYNRSHKTNIAVRAVKTEIGQEPECVKVSVVFWDDSIQDFGFCPGLVSQRDFPKFLREKLNLDNVRTLDPFWKYYTKDKEINTLLSIINFLRGQLYIQRLSLKEWQSLISRGQAKRYLETEIEFLTKKVKPKSVFPCPPGTFAPYTIPS